MEQVLYELPEGWEWKYLNEIFHIARGGSPRPIKNFITDDPSGINWIKIGDVKQGEKFITQTQEKIRPEGVKKSRMVYPGDFILSNSMSFGRPYIMQTQGCIHDGWLLLHPTYQELITEYMYYVLSSPYVYHQFSSSASGTTVKNLNSDLVRNIQVPIPPKKEQKRIVEKLDALLTRIDTAIEHLQESITLADALYASELASVFSLGQDKWPLKELNEVAEVARGKSKHRPRNDKSLFGGEYPFIQTGDVRNAQKYITTFSATYNEKGLQQSKLWPKGTICLTIAANIGDVAILGMDACFPDSVVGISSSELETDYLYYFLTTLQQQLDSKANAAAQKNINLKILSEIKIPVPTIDEQKNIVKQIKEIDRLSVKLKAEISEKITKMQQLKASILDSAFKGGL